MHEKTNIKQKQRLLDLAMLQLPEELHKPIIRKLKKRTVYSAFKYHIWGAYLADMQLINRFNNGFRFLLCVIDTLSKYARIAPLKDKKDKFQLLILFRTF